MKRFGNIVVGVNVTGSEHLISSSHGLNRFNVAAFEKARWVAEQSQGQLHVLAALEVDPHAETMIRRDAEAGRPTILDRAAERIERAVASARDAGVKVTTGAVLGHPAQALLDDAAEHDRTLIVVGTRDRGRIMRRLLGSTSLRILQQSPIPVLIARRGDGTDLTTVVAPIDFDACAPDILRSAEAFAGAVGAALHVVHVVDYSAEALLRIGHGEDERVEEYRRVRRADAQARFDALLEQHLAHPDRAQRHLLAGDASSAIMEFVDSVDAEFLVMGSAGTLGRRGRHIGRTAERVFPDVDVTLLVIKPPAS